MDQEAGKNNRQKNKKDPKVKQDFEETKDTREDARYLTRSLNHLLNSTVNQEGHHSLIHGDYIQKRVKKAGAPKLLGALGVSPFFSGSVVPNSEVEFHC